MKPAIAALCVYFAAIAYLLVGYWLNVADLLTGHGGEGAIYVCRIVGLMVAPLGATLGIFF